MKKDTNQSKDNLLLRPQKLNEYVGQESLKEKLQIYIAAAKKRNEPLDHILLYGPPGLGKTTLANTIANEMGGKIHLSSGPSIEKLGDMASILSDLQAGDILFIDEIHRLPNFVEECLYSVMEDFILTIIINNENECKTLTIPIPPFTLIGATTKQGSLSSPLRSRFSITEKINYYSTNDLKNIVVRTAKVFNMTIDEDSALEIAKRSRGTPRISNNIFKRIRDYVQCLNKTHVNMEDVIKTLELLNIDSLGLNEVDNKYLLTLINRFNGGPVGINTISNAIGEEANNIEEMCEPYLLQLGFIDKTAKGRIACKKSYEHFNLKFKEDRKNILN